MDVMGFSSDTGSSADSHGRRDRGRGQRGNEKKGLTCVTCVDEVRGNVYRSVYHLDT